MSKEAIEQVRAAEEQAAAIRKAAALAVKQQLDEAEAAGKNVCAEAEKEAERQSAERIDAARKDAERLTEEQKQKAQKDAVSVCAKAEENMDAAVGLIVEGVMRCGSK